MQKKHERIPRGEGDQNRSPRYKRRCVVGCTCKFMESKDNRYVLQKYKHCLGQPHTWPCSHESINVTFKLHEPDEHDNPNGPGIDWFATGNDVHNGRECTTCGCVMSSLRQSQTYPVTRLWFWILREKKTAVSRKYCERCGIDANNGGIGLCNDHALEAEQAQRQKKSIGITPAKTSWR